MTITLRDGEAFRRTVDIETFLRWAYRDELPKGEHRSRPVSEMSVLAPWDLVLRQGEMMTFMAHDGRVRSNSDLGEQIALNSFGLVPIDGGYDLGEPHADALTADRIVRLLDAAPVALPARWNPLPECGDLQGQEIAQGETALHRMLRVDTDGESRVQGGIGGLLRKWAVMGGAPDWRLDDKPVVDFVRDGRGGGVCWFTKVAVTSADGFAYEVEQDGYDVTKKRPRQGAYRKLTLRPDPALVCEARAEHELWVAGLALAVEMLGGFDEGGGPLLTGHHVVMSARAARPWIEGEATRGRVLDDLKTIVSLKKITPKPARGCDKTAENKAAAMAYARMQAARVGGGMGLTRQKLGGMKVTDKKVR